MRRSFRGLRVSAAAMVLLLATAAPALANDGPVNVGGGDGERPDEATVTTEVESPGKPAAKKPDRTPVDNSGRTSVGNYDQGTAPAPPRPAWELEGATEADRAAALEAGVTSYRDESGTPWSYTDPDAPTGIGGPKGWIPGAQIIVDQDPEAPQGAGGTPPAPQIDPAELAQTAVSQMELEAPEVASTPDDPDTLGAVGLPVWLWVANPGATTTGPNSTSATAGNVTVNATATFSGMTIDMGDGTTIECAGPGTEYPGSGIYESPDCGHVYEQMSDDQPDGLYTVGITAHWTVTWESNGGESGEIPVDLTTSKQLRIGSYQSVVTDVS